MRPTFPLIWHNVMNLGSRSYICGYCGSPLASERGWQANRTGTTSLFAHIYICHLCSGPTFFESKRQTPGVVFGEAVKDIPDDSVQNLYEEARKATGAGCYTAAVLCCRKLLMHIAVAKGAKAGESFVSYVEFLTKNHYVPPDAKGWVDYIREKGNEANHEISIMVEDDAEELIAYLEMLLKNIYEFPAAIMKKSTPEEGAAEAKTS